MEDNVVKTPETEEEVIIPEEANPMSGEAVELQLKEILREMFPHGDEMYVELTLAEMEGYNVKNFDYAAGGDPNGNFLRVASILSNYPGLRTDDPRVVALLYMLKQLDNVLWSLCRGFEGKLENIDKRLVDIHVYAKITRVLDARLKAGDFIDYPVSGGPRKATMVEEIQRVIKENLPPAVDDQEADDEDVVERTANPLNTSSDWERGYECGKAEIVEGGLSVAEQEEIDKQFGRGGE